MEHSTSSFFYIILIIPKMINIFLEISYNIPYILWTFFITQFWHCEILRIENSQFYTANSQPNMYHHLKWESENSTMGKLITFHLIFIFISFFNPTTEFNNLSINIYRVIFIINCIQQSNSIVFVSAYFISMHSIFAIIMHTGKLVETHKPGNRNEARVNKL